MRLLAALVEAGVTLDDAFRTLAAMGGTRSTRSAAARVHAVMRRGEPLSAALESVGSAVEVRSLVAAGEQVGNVAEAFRASADLLDRLETLRAGIQRAFVYPAVVLTLGLCILVLVAVAVVPPIERTFVSLGGELPIATRVVLAGSRPLRSPWVGLVVAVLALGGHHVRRERSRSLLHGLARLPFTRRIRRDVSLTVLSRYLATSVSGGLPLLEALRAAEGSMPAGRVRERVCRAATSVESGRSAFDDQALGGLFDAVERELLTVGERNGVLASQLRRVADRRGDALDLRIRTIATVTEPMLIVLVGALVGGAVLALYLPSFRVLELL